MLQRLGDARETCKDHPAFLATLGGNWLEEGDPTQALLWLERSLLLDPTLLGARADYALALAALGDNTARDELIAAWRDRADVPLLLRARLAAGTTVATVNGSAGALPARPRWAQSREITLLAGYETNLDRSPRLAELTLTFPEDGPITLPIDRRPRPGGATAADLAWQVAYSPDPATVFQGGLQATGRLAPGARETDWHNAQLAVSVSHRWSAWRGQLQLSSSLFGGQLNDPYRLDRVSTSLETGVLGCLLRMSLDWESRRLYGEHTIDSGRTLGGTWNTLCPMPYPRGWTIGVAFRGSTDKPSEGDRNFGTQTLVSGGLRVFGALKDGFQLDVSLRATRTLDSKPYAVVLGNVRRWQIPIQLSVELTHLLQSTPVGATEGVWQVQSIYQDSNLPLFKFNAAALFGGLRWRW